MENDNLVLVGRRDGLIIVGFIAVFYSLRLWGVA